MNADGRLSLIRVYRRSSAAIDLEGFFITLNPACSSFV